MMIIKRIKRIAVKVLEYFLSRHHLAIVLSKEFSGATTLGKIINYNKINLVLDVGACKGKYVELIREGGYQGKIVAFEPIKEAFLSLSEATKNDPQCECHHLAIGAADGFTEINVSQNIDSSSLLPILPLHLECCPQSRIVHKERVEMKRLDSFCSKWLNPTDKVFLKIDVQGYESEVIRGAKDILPFIHLIQLELSVIPLYQGQLLYLDMFEIMRQNGYALILIIPGFSNPTNEEMLQFDAVFKKIT